MARMWALLLLMTSLQAAQGQSFEEWLLQPHLSIEQDKIDHLRQRMKPNAIPLPGLGVPQRSVASFACRIQWDEYISVLVVLPQPGIKQQAWLATFLVEHTVNGRQLRPQINYSGEAYIDTRGDIHFDFRDAGCVGEMAGKWYPDSFVVQQNSRVRILDTKNNGNWGRVIQLSWPQSYQRDDPVLEAIINQENVRSDYSFLRERLLVHFELSGKLL